MIVRWRWRCHEEGWCEHEQGRLKRGSKHSNRVYQQQIFLLHVCRLLNPLRCHQQKLIFICNLISFVIFSSFSLCAWWIAQNFGRQQHVLLSCIILKNFSIENFSREISNHRKIAKSGHGTVDFLHDSLINYSSTARSLRAVKESCRVIILHRLHRQIWENRHLTDWQWAERNQNSNQFYH